MTEMTTQELMSRIPDGFEPEKAAGLSAVIQLHLTGAEGGVWVMRIEDGKCTVEQGNAPSPKLTLTADAQDFKNLVLGKLDGMAAFMQGKLKLAGDLNLALKLTNFLKVK
jgi:putative sterol carrier protein